MLDIGGCWGWHWRKADIQRPDITVVIVDLVRENLLHANEVLKDQVAKQKVFLVHGNACALEFEDDAFDGVWSVQTTQHIPDFSLSCSEIYRVLKTNGIYWDYGLNNAALIRHIYKLFGKTYHVEGVIDGKFFLRRVNDNVIRIVKDTFHADPVIGYSELLFTPDLGVPIGGKEDSRLGNLDSNLTSNFFIWKLFARQSSFHVRKTD